MDREARVTVPLDGADEAYVRAEFDADELNRVTSADGIKNIARQWAPFITWNVVDDDGRPVRFTPEVYLQLRVPVQLKLRAAITASVARTIGEDEEAQAGEPDPNSSTARSRSSTRTSGSRIRALPKAG